MCDNNKPRKGGDTIVECLEVIVEDSNDYIFYNYYKKKMPFVVQNIIKHLNTDKHKKQTKGSKFSGKETVS